MRKPLICSSRFSGSFSSSCACSRVASSQIMLLVLSHFSGKLVPRDLAPYLRRCAPTVLASETVWCACELHLGFRCRHTPNCNAEKPPNTAPRQNLLSARHLHKQRRHWQYSHHIVSYKPRDTLGHNLAAAQASSTPRLSTEKDFSGRPCSRTRLSWQPPPFEYCNTVSLSSPSNFGSIVPTSRFRAFSSLGTRSGALVDGAVGPQE